MQKNIEDLLDFGEFSKKKRVNSKRKGSTFERKIAKMMNERFDTKEFSRTPGSGAFATSHKNLPENLRISGDLITPITFPFVVECKNGYDVQLDDLFKRKSDFHSRRMALVVVGKPYGVTPEISLNGKYFIYPLDEFLKLSNEVFGFHS